MNGLNKTCEQLIYLISCALRKAKADAGVLEGIDLPHLLILARKHSVAAMVCMALEKTVLFAQADPEVKKQWLDVKNKAVRKNMLLDADRKTLMDEMKAAGIWHMPLKGCILQNWYPQYGMREMSDNDILIDASKRAEVRELFLNHGYSERTYGKSNHDAYTKFPVYNFEMHIALFDDIIYEDFAGEFANIREKLLCDEESEYELHFTLEDFYIYGIAHAYKHYSHGGTGIRTLTDIYVMNQKIGAALDWHYVNTKLDLLGIRGYETCSRVLSEKIFGSESPIWEIALADEERQMLLYQLESSTYGTIQNTVNNRLHALQSDNRPITRSTKLKYCIDRLFPDREWCRSYCPFIYRHLWLLPAFWVWRIITKSFSKRKKVWRELATIKSSK